MGMKKEMNDARKLMTHFNDRYEEKYRKQYVGNSHSDVWGFRTMMQDLGFEGAQKVINYYFKTDPNRGHTREHLLYNYHSYKEARDAAVAQRKAEAKMLRKMKEDFGEG